MTKEELIQYSAAEVRSTSHLYSEFLRIYKDEHGSGCASCQFKTTFAAWQAEKSQNYKTMSQNTFILKEPNVRFRVNDREILSAKASDEIALKWLSLESYGGNPTTKENLEKVFKVLPSGYGEETADYSKMKKADLQAIATQNEYPEAEWKLLNVEPLREYISAKASEVKNSEEENAEIETTENDPETEVDPSTETE